MGLGIGEQAIYRQTDFFFFNKEPLFITTPLPAVYFPCDLRGKLLLTRTETGLLRHSVHSLRPCKAFMPPPLVVTCVGKTRNQDTCQTDVAVRKVTHSNTNTTVNSKSAYKYERLPIFQAGISNCGEYAGRLMKSTPVFPQNKYNTGNCLLI